MPEQLARATRNNNPLNVKSSDFTRGFEGVTGVDPEAADDGGQFLTFDSPDSGFAAANRLLEAPGYADLPLDAAMKRWSNSGYGADVAPDLDATARVRDLQPEQRTALVQSMAKREGYGGTAPAAATSVEVELPDGTIIDLGPNPTPELRAQVKAKIRERFPELATPTEAPDNATTTSTTTTPTKASVPSGTQRLRAQTVEDAGAEINRNAGLPDDHWIGKYTAAIGKPATDALQDLYDFILRPPVPGMDFREGVSQALKAVHVLGVPGEAAGNVAFQAAQDAGLPPTAQAIIGSVVGLFAGAKTPLPGFSAAGEVAMPLQGTNAARAAASEAAGVASRGAQWAGAAREAAEGATATAAREADDAAQAASAAAAKTAPSAEAAARAKSALAPADVTVEQGGQAIQTGLEKGLADVKDPVQGIYRAVAESSAGKTLDPAKYQGISESIGAIESELGPTLTGQPKQVMSTLKEKIDKAERLTYEDLDAFKSQLDSLFPGRTPLGATPKTAALYQFKWDVRNLMRDMVEGDERQWLDVANSMWRDQVIPKEKLVALVKKSDPMTVVERLFGNGGSDKQAAMAKRVLGELGDDPAGTGEAIKQAVMSRLMTKAADAEGNVDPPALLKSYDGFTDTFRDAVTNPGARTFFTVLRQEQEAAKGAAEAAKSAARIAKTVAREGKSATKEAERLASGAAKDATAKALAAAEPNRLAQFTAKGLEIAVVDTAAAALGYPGLGGFGLLRFVLPPDPLAKALANSKTANALARALKTPLRSAIVPTLLQQLKKLGVGDGLVLQRQNEAA